MRTVTLKPSLEGWKHDYLVLLGEILSALETFLRGMETYSSGQLGPPPDCPLKPSLEGWKLGP